MKRKSLFCIIIIGLILFSCDKSTSPEVYEIKEVKIIASTRDDFTHNCHTEMQIENKIVEFKQSNFDGTEIEKSDQLSIDEWTKFLSKINLGALATIKMKPRCGNQLESYMIYSKSDTFSFGFEIGSSPESVHNQLEGNTEQIIDLIVRIREIRENLLQ